MNTLNKASCFQTGKYRMMATVVENVPILGESITEGSIASWSKKVGDRVEVDDVVVVIETDKVTVDVKATRSGVLTKQLATETVIVGKPLYEIHADANQTIPPTTVGTPASTTGTTAAITTTAATTAANTSHSHASKSTSSRTPLIKFIGKRDRKKVALPSVVSTATTTAGTGALPRAPLPKKPQTGVEFTTLKDTAWYGRPKISQKEMDAIMSGGAY